jgi:hypothetical protein
MTGQYPGYGFWALLRLFLIAAALLSASRVWAVSPTNTSLFLPTNTINTGGFCAFFPNGAAPAPKPGLTRLRTCSSAIIESSLGPETKSPVIGQTVPSASVDPSGKGHSPHWLVVTIPADCATKTNSPHIIYASPSFLYERKTAGFPLNGSNCALSDFWSWTARLVEKYWTIEISFPSLSASLPAKTAFLAASPASLSALSDEPCATLDAVSASSADFFASPASFSSCNARSSFVFCTLVSRRPSIASIRTSPTIPITTSATLRSSKINLIRLGLSGLEVHARVRAFCQSFTSMMWSQIMKISSHATPIITIQVQNESHHSSEARSAAYPESIVLNAESSIANMRADQVQILTIQLIALISICGGAILFAPGAGCPRSRF